MRNEQINNLEAGRLGVGTAQFGMDYGITNTSGQINEVDAHEILKVAYENGVRTIDTATSYGASEAVIGSYLSKNEQERWEVVTKIVRSSVSVADQLRESIKKLGQVPYAVLVHRVSDYLDRSTRCDLWELKNTLGISKIGVSVYSIEDINKVLENEVPSLIQLPINALDTQIVQTGTLEMLCEKGVEIHARSIFLQGVLFQPLGYFDLEFKAAKPAIVKLWSIAREEKLTVAQLSLMMVSSFTEINKIVVGIDNLKQLNDNLSLIGHGINRSVVDKIVSICFSDKGVLNPAIWKNR